MVRNIAKVFMSGRSQAVRIPAAFRIATSEVTIVRRGSSLVLTPRTPMTWNRFFAEYACPDFELDRSESQKGQSREIFA